MLNKRGFVLLDALVSVMIVALLSLLVLCDYRIYENYEKATETFMERENERLMNLFQSCNDCLILKENDE